MPNICKQTNGPPTSAPTQANLIMTSNASEDQHEKDVAEVVFHADQVHC